MFYKLSIELLNLADTFIHSSKYIFPTIMIVLAATVLINLIKRTPLALAFSNNSSNNDYTVICDSNSLKSKVRRTIRKITQI